MDVLPTKPSWGLFHLGNLASIENSGLFGQQENT